MLVGGCVVLAYRTCRQTAKCNCRSPAGRQAAIILHRPSLTALYVNKFVSTLDIIVLTLFLQTIIMVPIRHHRNAKSTVFDPVFDPVFNNGAESAPLLNSR